jgi:hypothetical protein
MANLYCLLDHHSIALLIATIRGNKRNSVGGVVRPRPIARTTMVTTLLTNDNNILPIDGEVKRQKTEVKS